MLLYFILLLIVNAFFIVWFYFAKLFFIVLLPLLKAFLPKINKQFLPSEIGLLLKFEIRIRFSWFSKKWFNELQIETRCENFDVGWRCIQKKQFSFRWNFRFLSGFQMLPSSDKLFRKKKFLTKSYFNSSANCVPTFKAHLADSFLPSSWLDRHHLDEIFDGKINSPSFGGFCLKSAPAFFFSATIFFSCPPSSSSRHFQRGMNAQKTVAKTKSVDYQDWNFKA